MFKAIGALRVVALAGVLAFSLGSPAGAVSVAFKGVVPEEAVGGLDAVELIDGNQVKGRDGSLTSTADSSGGSPTR